LYNCPEKRKVESLRRVLLVAGLLLPSVVVGQTNLKFQDGREGEVPSGWFVLDAKSVGYSASWYRQGCHGELPCAALSAPANSAPESFGTLMQNFAATPFRGERVRLRAWIRLEKNAPTDFAQMLLHVGRPGFSRASPTTWRTARL
jgi:hypothetical protein